MKGSSMWFSIGLGLFTILCTVAIALAAARIGYTVVGEGGGRKTGDVVAAPQSGVPDERQGNQSKTLGATPSAARTANTVAGVRGRNLAEESDLPDEEDAL